jgi:hypothetical protein
MNEVDVIININIHKLNKPLILPNAKVSMKYYTLPLYYNNTKFMLNVEKSNIENAGLGIFTYEDIPKEVQIGYYIGVLKEGDDDCVGDYSFSLNKKYYLDAHKHPRCYVAMINDAHNSKFKNNCEFRIELEDSNGKKYKPHERKITLWSIKKIKKYNELFASYGTDYWKYR